MSSSCVVLLLTITKVYCDVCRMLMPFAVGWIRRYWQLERQTATETSCLPGSKKWRSQTDVHHLTAWTLPMTMWCSGHCKLWFHFSCEQLSDKPMSPWYCTFCRSAANGNWHDIAVITNDWLLPWQVKLSFTASLHCQWPGCEWPVCDDVSHRDWYSDFRSLRVFNCRFYV